MSNPKQPQNDKCLHPENQEDQKEVLQGLPQTRAVSLYRGSQNEALVEDGNNSYSITELRIKLSGVTRTHQALSHKLSTLVARSDNNRNMVFSNGQNYFQLNQQIEDIQQILIRIEKLIFMWKTESAAEFQKINEELSNIKLRVAELTIIVNMSFYALNRGLNRLSGKLDSISLNMNTLCTYFELADGEEWAEARRKAGKEMEAERREIEAEREECRILEAEMRALVAGIGSFRALRPKEVMERGETIGMGGAFYSNSGA